MKIKMLQGLAGTEYSLLPGDVHECADDEAIRLIATGAAAPHDEQPSEKAVKRGPAETR